MDGIHDLGGRQGFGAVRVDESDEQFHEPWEARVRGIVNAMGRPPDWSVDWFRHCRELIDPVDYLTRPYFDQWVQTYAAMLVNSGVASVEELASGRSASGRALEHSAPMTAAAVATAQPSATRYDREIAAPPRFAPGARVRAHRHGRDSHTRLPAYVRGAVGSVHAHHGAHVLPDACALGEERHEHLYTVSFAARELWGESANANDRVLVNLWESYLDGC